MLPLTAFDAMSARSSGSVRGARNQPFSLSPVQAGLATQHEDHEDPRDTNIRGYRLNRKSSIFNVWFAINRFVIAVKKCSCVFVWTPHRLLLADCSRALRRKIGRRHPHPRGRHSGQVPRHASFPESARQAVLVGLRRRLVGSLSLFVCLLASAVLVCRITDERTVEHRMDRCDVEPREGLHEGQPWMCTLLRRSAR